MVGFDPSRWREVTQVTPLLSIRGSNILFLCTANVLDTIPGRDVTVILLCPYRMSCRYFDDCGMCFVEKLWRTLIQMPYQFPKEDLHKLTAQDPYWIEWKWYDSQAPSSMGWMSWMGWLVSLGLVKQATICKKRWRLLKIIWCQVPWWRSESIGFFGGQFDVQFGGEKLPFRMLSNSV